MEIRIRKPGKIGNKPLGIEVYTDYLAERLKDENKGVVRKYIRAKIRMLSNKPARVRTPA